MRGLAWCTWGKSSDPRVAEFLTKATRTPKVTGASKDNGRRPKGQRKRSLKRSQTIEAKSSIKTDEARSLGRTRKPAPEIRGQTGRGWTTVQATGAQKPRAGMWPQREEPGQER